MYQHCRKIREATNNVIELARSTYKGYNIPACAISFSNRMTTTAGVYKYRPRSNKVHEIVFSLPIINNNNVDEFMADTVIHEVAHFIDKVVNGNTGHNARFYGIMRRLGHKNPSRCHSFEIQRRKTKTYSYQCQACGHVIEFSALRHGKVRRGEQSYHHKKCGATFGILKFLG